VLPYAAYLRVYDPLIAFPQPDQSRWAAYAGSTERPRRVAALEAEHAESLRRLVPARSSSEERQNAYVRRFQGKTYICPWQSSLRSWTAFSAAQGLLTDGPEPYIRSSTWHVPYAWFVPFTRDERWLSFGRDEAAPRGLMYVTSMAQARNRLARAALVRKRLDLPFAELPFGDVESLYAGLRGFHPEALIELDYGGLVHLMTDEALAADDSVGESAVALTALERGQSELTVAMHGRLRDRWRRVHALYRAN
jgi:hypothetical protein